MAKKIQGYIKLQILGGQANPSPPVGPALGQQGVNIMEFCKAFNAATQASQGIPTPVVITVYQDRSFTFVTRKPPVSYYLKKEAKIQKGAKMVGQGTFVGKVSVAQCRKIAEEKMVDMNAFDLDAATSMVVGSARSMGLEVEGA